ncbi:MAG TPA: TOMM precursor leader peptide-binding protein [Solirubrobacteraceae bacterium]
MELSGESAADLVEHVFAPGAAVGVEEIVARLPGYRPASLVAELERLVGEGVLVEERDDAPRELAPFAALLDEIGLGAAPTLERLREATVLVTGLEAHGAHVARLLAEAGVGRLVLADPFPLDPAHLALTGLTNAEDVGVPREDALAQQLARPGLEVATAGELDRERMAGLVEGCRLAIACWDRAYHAAHHWVNAAALRHDVPALFGELHATRTYAGPLYLPGRSACWMCYRMRRLACEQDFDRAMAVEEHLDRKRAPALAERPLLPGLPAQLGAALALEAIRLLVKLHQPALVDKVVEHDAILAETRTHPVLVKPYCPTCSKRPGRVSPAADRLRSEPPPSGPPLHELRDRLVSGRTGIVADLQPSGRDATEPAQPQVWRGRLANHLFLSEPEDAHMAVSGKGMTREAAWDSCLGEAVERYSGGCWDAEETVYCRRDELAGRSLDPADLVLYAPDQYATLRYAAYTPETRLRWVRGRSLVHDDEVWIPAIAVFMEYQAAAEEEFLFPVTSNGLAAGPSRAAAVLEAIHEVIERDAAMIAWANRLPAVRYDAETHPDEEVRRLARAYRRRGVELAIYRLPADHDVAVMLAVAFQRRGRGPFAVVGLGAALDPCAAGRAAALEVGQVRPAFRERARTHDAPRIAELVADPAATTSLEDHALLYADPAMAEAFAFLDGGGTADWPAPEPLSPAEELGRVVDGFAAAGQDVLYVDLTPPDLEPLGLYTARAVLPGFQPIWFGEGERRLGGRRLFDLPRRLGLRDAPSDAASLNPLPHPIA